MPQEEHYHETTRFRCLEYLHRQSDSLYLTMCGMEHCTPGKAYGPASRSGYHLHVILTGEGTMEVNGQHMILHSGQLFLEKPGEVTHYYAHRDNPWTYCWVTFSGTKAEYYMRQAGFADGVNVLNSYVDTNEFYDLANQLLTKPELNLANDLRRQGLLYQFISLAVESHNRSSNGHRNAEYSPDSYVDHALDFIRNNYASIKVADISNYIGINRSYFTNIFKQRVGISPREYLISIKLRESAQLLISSELPVQDISRRVGYDNPLTFSKMFKRAYGVSPKHYRSQPEEERRSLQAPALPQAGR